MTPEQRLQHHDQGLLWSPADRSATPADVPSAYQQALAVRQLRLQRGEAPRGYKIGFTNRTIWPLYNVFAPIWGTVWAGGLSMCDGEGSIDLTATCQPRIEPEIVFGLRATPAHNATVDQLFDAIEWLAPGFEVVQSHCPDWKFVAAEAVGDSGLHARLLVGPRVPVRSLAADAAALNTLLAQAQVTLQKNGQTVAPGDGRECVGQPAARVAPLFERVACVPGCRRPASERCRHHRHLDRCLCHCAGRAVVGALLCTLARFVRDDEVSGAQPLGCPVTRGCSQRVPTAR
jgi:2-keto-4-pentenoate hydratase